MAQEKSSLSLMFKDKLVFWRVLPICSAILMNLWPKILSLMGSTTNCCSSWSWRVFSVWRSMTTCELRMRACAVGITTIVCVLSMIMAGPSTRLPATRSPSRKTLVGCIPPCEKYASTYEMLEFNKSCQKHSQLTVLCSPVATVEKVVSLRSDTSCSLP